MSDTTAKSSQTQSSAPKGLSPLLTAVMLVAIVLLGGYFRFMSLNWDDFTALHPDERYLTLNLLPQIGDALQFTPDNEHFPPHTALTRASETILLTTTDVLINDATSVGTVRNDISTDVASWWLNDTDRIVRYNTPEEANQGLINGTVDVILLPELTANRFINANVRQIGTFDSIRVQELRCTSLHPDTNGVGGYFDTYCSSLNPHNAFSGSYAYGTLPLFMAHFTGELMASLDENVQRVSYQQGVLIWRFFSALFDAAAIVLIFFIGSRMRNRTVGLIAALLYACAPLAIQKAHFGTVNAITAFFVTLALWSALNVQDKGKFIYYAIFGFALGSALAGRINVIPLAGVVVLAGMVNAAPILDSRIPWSERERLLWRNVIGVFIAGATTVLTFRLFNPYAFTGPSFFHIIPNMRWIADAQGSSFAVSGASDAPPNFQWLARLPFLYPLSDMLLWGMGITMGVMAWLGFAWSGVRLALGRSRSMRNILLFAWVLVYFGWIGDLWVMTMRYYLPLYSSLALFAAWAIYELIDQARERDADLPLTRILLVLFSVFFGLVAIVQASTTALTATGFASGLISVSLLVVAFVPAFKYRAVTLGAFVVAFTVIWGTMFTNIYQHQLTRVQAARWASENISGDFSMQIQGAPEGTPIINIGIFNRSGNSATSPAELPQNASRLEVGAPYLHDFTAPASGTITEVYAPHLADAFETPDPDTLYISVARADTLELLAEVNFTAEFTRDSHPLGESYTIPFDEPITLEEGVDYIFKVEAMSGAITTAGEVILTEGTWDDRITTVSLCELPDGMTYTDDPPSGLVSATECNGMTLNRSLLQSYDLAMSYPVDEQLKYDSLNDGLRVGDYIAITSNRFYDTETRNPMRFPMTTAYYETLFNGELGFELVATFSEGYELGPFSVDDQHLPIYESPQILNEFEADEAFHVYDHPAVFIFRKTADYDHANTELILSTPLQRIEQLGFGSTPMNAQIPGVIYTPTLESDEAPTALHQPDEVQEINRSGGTWSDRFARNSILNQSQPIGVVVWWLTIIAIGWLTFPILFTAFPNLGDGGYGFSKIVGMLLIGWIAWFGANFRLPLWSQGGLIGVSLVLLCISAYLVYSRREAFLSFLSQNFRRLLAIEVITLVLFVALIGVRLTNPDLWHHPMGGEKPMDFAYFNAVLRTTVFPAYDPWYAGGNLNYYYFGYVIVGVPVLLLKIVPAFAYNLLVPTVFATTGIGAFSAAFNIVDSWKTRRIETHDSEKVAVQRRLGNPWVAGITALLLCVVLGNLDTPRILIEEGIARLGGYERPTGLENFLRDQYIEENGILPAGDDLTVIQQRAEANNLADRIVYETSIRIDLFNSFGAGLQRAIAGDPLPIGSNRWYWGPTRIISETPGVGGNAITEMPYFTFVYGDLHAHMISMPLMLFALAFVFYEVRNANRDDRTIFAQGLALFLGALTIGMMKATNTWDWPSFMLLATIGLGYAWWRRWERTFDTRNIPQRLLFIAIEAAILGVLVWRFIEVSETSTSFLRVIHLYALILVAIVALLWHGSQLINEGFNRLSLMHMLVYVGGFLGLAAFVVAPYDYWFASNYSSIRLWEGAQTPLWAYWNIHGLFLFLITSLLLWETGRWLRETRVRDLRGNTVIVQILGGILILTIVAALAAMLLGYTVGLIVIPLIVWIGILFFRPGQSLALQYILVLAGFALAITLGTEIVVLDGDIGRQNTVFKFYIQVWLIFSVVGGAAFAWLLQHADRWRLSTQLVWFIPLMFMVAAAAMFPFSSTRARMVDRFVPDLPPTLNGLDYMSETNHYLIDFGVVIPLDNDYQIITWLQDNVEGTPVIMEGRSLASEYRYNGRISINTGLPTVLGWRWHQIQQRTIEPLNRFIPQRESNIQYFYGEDDIISALEMIRYYDIEYIIVSDMERAMYPDGIDKFNRMVEMGILSVAFQHGEGVVYQVDHPAVNAQLIAQSVFNDAVELDFTLLPAFVPGSAVVGRAPDTGVDISLALDALLENNIEHLVMTNPPRLIQFQPVAYDRFIRLETLGILVRVSDNEQQRLYRVDTETLNNLAIPESHDNSNVESRTP